MTTRRVERSEVVDYMTYTSDVRPEFRKRIVGEVKPPRRIHLGDDITFLFENHDTILYQVQEMMRVERIVRESDIQHEIDTYNELLGVPGGLGCTMLIEIDDEQERAEKLSSWLPLVGHLYIEVEGGDRVGATYDERQVGETRLSSVQYLHFELGGRAPVAIGCDFDGYPARTDLDDAQRSALSADLAEA